MGRHFTLGFQPPHQPRRWTLNQVRVRRTAMQNAREIATFWTAAEIVAFWGRGARYELPPRCVWRRRYERSHRRFAYAPDAGAVGE